MPAPPLGLTARATITRVVDGDTVDVTLTIPVRVRLLRCWAPEITGIEQFAGHRAKEALERMAPVGSRVHVQVPTDQADSLSSVLTFGRALGRIWREGDDDDLSSLMVAAGHATTEKVAR